MSSPSSLPRPPVADWKFDPPEIFPSYPRILEDAKRHAGIFTYDIIAGKRMTFLTDTAKYDIVFEPAEESGDKGQESPIRMDMERAARQFFGINKEVCPYTRAGLDGLRVRALNPKTCAEVGGLNDIVGEDIAKSMNNMPDSGEMSLLEVAEFTYAGVNRALFGEGVVPSSSADFFYEYDEVVALATTGLPKSPKFAAAYDGVERMFQDAIEAGRHKGPNAARGIVGRLSPLPADMSPQLMASFLVSIFWAPQANTLPMTYWMLAHILEKPEWTARVRAEADRWGQLGPGGRYFVDREDDECLPFTRACMNETLRIYIANGTIRKVQRDFEISMSDGKRYCVPAGDNFMITSYTTHYDEEVFPEPHVFRPERWLDDQGRFNEKAISPNHFIPFGKGRYSCSGRHLLTLELPTLVAMFIQRFDARLVDPVPEPDWSFVVASVRPKGWPHDFPNKIKFSRRRMAKI